MSRVKSEGLVVPERNGSRLYKILLLSEARRKPLGKRLLVYNKKLLENKVPYSSI